MKLRWEVAYLLALQQLFLGEEDGPAGPRLSPELLEVASPLIALGAALGRPQPLRPQLARTAAATTTALARYLYAEDGLPDRTAIERLATLQSDTLGPCRGSSSAAPDPARATLHLAQALAALVDLAHATTLLARTTAAAQLANAVLATTFAAGVFAHPASSHRPTPEAPAGHTQPAA